MTDAQPERKGQCPSDALLQSLATGGVDEAHERQVVEHLGECSRCQQRLQLFGTSADFEQNAARWLSNLTPISEGLSALMRDAESDIRELTGGESVNRAPKPPTHDTSPDGEITGLDRASVPTGYADLTGWLDTDGGQQKIGRFGNYRLVEFIGRGGMGVVFKGVDDKLNRSVAIKILSPSVLIHHESIERFTREARAVAAINHPGIVTIYSVEDTGSLPGFAMEFVDGPSLHDLLQKKGRLSERETLKVGWQIARALAAAHAQGIVHRDIKPANVLIDRKSQRVKLTDFGLAHTAGNESLTSTGILVGTPAYMPPEALAENKSVDKTGDLFSLGVLLYRMISGLHPFEADTQFATLKRIADLDFQPLKQVVPEVSPELERLVNRLMERDPADRVQSAKEVANELKRLSQAQPNDSSDNEKTERTSPPAFADATRRVSNQIAGFFGNTRRRIAIVGLLIFSCVALGVANWPDSSTDPTLSPNLRGPEGIDLTSGTTHAESLAAQEHINSNSSPASDVAAVSRLAVGSVESSRNAASVGSNDNGPPPGQLPVTSGSEMPVESDQAAAPGRPVAVYVDGSPEPRMFDEIDDAIEFSPSGSTIEIRSDGPFHTGPLDFDGKSLTITAGDGVEPRLILLPDDDELPLFHVEGDAVLRGLHLEADADSDGGSELIICEGDSFEAQNCRFIADEDASAILIESLEASRFLNCEFYSRSSPGVSWYAVDGGELQAENCLFAGAISMAIDDTEAPVSVSIDNCTMIAMTAFSFSFENIDSDDADPIRLGTSNSLFAATEVFIQMYEDGRMNRDRFARILSWSGNSNFWIEPDAYIAVVDVSDDDRTTVIAEDADDLLDLANIRELQPAIGHIEPADSWEQVVNSIEDGELVARNLIQQLHPVTDDNAEASRGAEFERLGPGPGLAAVERQEIANDEAQ